LTGPSFGGGDLRLFNLIGIYGMDSCHRNSYDKPIREIEGGFSVEECEVFRIYKNET
jgi:hypothetical protein